MAGGDRHQQPHLLCPRHWANARCRPGLGEGHQSIGSSRASGAPNPCKDLSSALRLQQKVGALILNFLLEDLV